MIKVLIVEDSPTIQDLLMQIFKSDPEMGVVKMVSNGVEALKATAQIRPDIITMDLHMPYMDGLEATRLIMESYPTPIIILSGADNLNEVTLAMKIVEAGAVTALPRPYGPGHPQFEETKKELLKMVRTMSEVKVIRRWPSMRQNNHTQVPSHPLTQTHHPKHPKQLLESFTPELVAIGASTGGPIALQAILSRLPPHYPFPILIVQHIAPGFIDGLIEWLSASCPLKLQLASSGQRPLPHHVYFAKDGFNLEIDENKRFQLTPPSFTSSICPSVSSLFKSIVTQYKSHTVGILLSGMGQDGAYELKLMKDQGHLTMAQNEESSLIFGMPREAISLGAAQFILSPDRMAALLLKMTENQGQGKRGPT